MFSIYKLPNVLHDKEGHYFWVSQALRKFVEKDPSTRQVLSDKLKSTLPKKRHIFHGFFPELKYKINGIRVIISKKNFSPPQITAEGDTTDQNREVIRKILETLIDNAPLINEEMQGGEILRENKVAILYRKPVIYPMGFRDSDYAKQVSGWE